MSKSKPKEPTQVTPEYEHIDVEQALAMYEKMMKIRLFE